MPSSFGFLHDWPTPVHLAFITAMEDELTPVRRFAPDWREFEIDGFPHYYAEIKFGDTNLAVVACSPYQMGAEATISALHRLHKLKPKGIVMTGICAGWREKNIQQGDVIVAERAFFPDEGKLTDQRMVYDTRTFEPVPSLLTHLKSVEHTLRWSQDISVPRPHSRQYLIDLVLCEMEKDPTQFSENRGVWKLIRDNVLDAQKVREWLIKGNYLNEAGNFTDTARKRIGELQMQNAGELRPIPERSSPVVHYRTFATVPNVVAVEGAFSQYEERVRSIGAMEMEVAALYKTANELRYELVFAVKGVQDYGTPDKDDLFRVYAAEAAARWVFAFIAQKWTAIANDSNVINDHMDLHRTDDNLSSKHGDSVGRLARIRSELTSINSDPVVLQSYDKILRDLERVWSQSIFNISPEQVQSVERIFDFADSFRNVLIQTSITSVSNNYSAPLIGAAIKLGIWDSAEAINIAERIPDHNRRADVCIAILEVQVSSEEALRLHRIFFDAAKKFTASSLYIDALKKIAPMIHSSFVEEALQLIREIHFLSERATALAVLLPFLDEPRIQVLVRECLTEISLGEDRYDRGRALAAIAPHLSNDLVEAAIAIIRELDNRHDQASIISAISPRLTPAQVRVVFQIAASIRDGKERAQSISALANVLPQDLIGDALANVENVDEIFARNTALVDLSTRVSDPVKKIQILDSVFHDISSSDNTFTRSDFPTRWLYSKLPNDYQIRAIKSSFETGIAVFSGWHRAEALGLAVFRLCEREDRIDFEAMFEHGFYALLHLAVAQCGSLTALLPYLPESYRVIAIQTIQNTLELPITGEDEWEKQQSKKDRITWATRILPYLAETERQMTLQIVWKLAFSLPQQNERFDALAPLIPILNGREVRYLLNVLGEITDFSSRAVALARIVRQLSRPKQREIVKKILTSYLPQIVTEREKATIIAQISRLLEGKQLQDCMDIVLLFREETSVAVALANIAASSPVPPIEEIYQIALKRLNGDVQALVIESIAERLTAKQITECLPLVNSLGDIQRKMNILRSFAPKLTQDQVQDCLAKIQDGKEKLINIVVASSLISVMESGIKKDFLENSVSTIIATPTDTSQFGIVWAAASVADFLYGDTKNRVLNHAYQAATAMSGNMASYPGGNPKTNAFKRLIPKLNYEMQQASLREIQTIPHLGGILGEYDNPVSEVIESVASDLSEELISTAIDLLANIEDGWSKTHALETVAGRTTEHDWNRFIAVARDIESGWMRARVSAALLEPFPNKERIIKLVHDTLLVHLLQATAQTREELLWSVDVHLFKKPFMSEETLEQLAHHIIDICDEWK